MPPPSPSPLRVSLTARFCTFLQVLLHTLLHHHRVYPTHSFTQHRHTGLIVPFCTSPSVASYITRTLTALHPLLLDNLVRQITILILPAPHQRQRQHPPLEHPQQTTPIARYVLDLNLVDHHDFPPTQAPSLSRTLAALDVHLRSHLASLLAKPVTDHSPHHQHLTWDLVVRTTGVQLTSDWVSADGPRERGHIQLPLAVPIKDADIHSDTIHLSSRVEYPHDLVD